MNIVSQIKINGQWVDQKSIPEAVARSIIKKVIEKGMENIHFVPEKTEEKTA